MFLEFIGWIICIVVICLIITIYETLRNIQRSYYFKLQCAVISGDTVPVKTRLVKIADKIFKI